MCGIVGYAGVYKADREKAFINLLQIDVIRGPHSTGVALVKSTGDHGIFKQVGPPEELLLHKPFIDALTTPCRVYMGHNRAATVGKVNKANAHPFQINDIVGMHNGTLRGTHRFTNSRTYDVDSQMLIDEISLNGIEEAWKKMEGAAAIVWWNVKDKTLHMARNDERPLHIAFTAKGDGVFWASEDWMLDGILARHGIDHMGVAEIEVDTAFKLTVPINHIGVDEKAAKIKVGKKKLDPFVPVGYSVYKPANPSTNKPLNAGGGRTNSPTFLENAGRNAVIIGDNGAVDANNYYYVKPTGTQELANRFNRGLNTRYIVGHFMGRTDIKFSISLGNDADSKVLSAALISKKAGFKACFPSAIQRNGVIYHQAYPGDVSIIPDIEEAFAKRCARLAEDKEGGKASNVAPFFQGSSVVTEQPAKKPNQEREASVEETQEGMPTRNCFGSDLTRVEFDESYKNCLYCGDPLLFEDAEIHFIGEEEGICGNCAPLGEWAVYASYGEYSR